MKNCPYDLIVFTDASHKKRDDIGYAGYGVAILNVHTMKYVTFGDGLGDKTIACAELWAIYKGIDKALKICGRNEPAKVLVVTDSKLNVNGLTLYFNKYWDTSDWYHWKTANGKPVKNQAIYRATMELVQSYKNVRVRIAHIHGHTGKSGIPTLMNDLEKHGIRSDKETIKLFQMMNREVDKIAGSMVDRDIKLTELYGEIPRLERKEFSSDG